MPQRSIKGGATPQQNFLLQFLIFALQKNSNKEEENFVSAFCPCEQTETPP